MKLTTWILFTMKFSSIFYWKLNKQVSSIQWGSIQTSADSTVRVLSLSRFYPDFRKIVSGFCLDFLSGICLSRYCQSRFCELPGFCPNFRKKAVRCLSGRTRTRQSCPGFHCPYPPTSGSINGTSWLVDVSRNQ